MQEARYKIKDGDRRPKKQDAEYKMQDEENSKCGKDCVVLKKPPEGSKPAYSCRTNLREVEENINLDVGYFTFHGHTSLVDY